MNRDNPMDIQRRLAAKPCPLRDIFPSGPVRTLPRCPSPRPSRPVMAGMESRERDRGI